MLIRILGVVLILLVAIADARADWNCWCGDRYDPYRYGSYLGGYKWRQGHYWFDHSRAYDRWYEDRYSSYYWWGSFYTRRRPYWNYDQDD